MRNGGDIGAMTGASDRQYRRGTIMGLTMAEAFILISFALLLLLGAWKAQADREAARLERFEALSPEQISALGAIIDGGQLSLSSLAHEAERWRLIDSDELRRMVDAAEDLPADLHRDLADLVEIADPDGLAQILAATERVPEDSELEARLAGIGRRLSEAQYAEEAMVADLRRTLGGAVSEIGGHIDAEGSIVLPDTVLFELGRARITPRMRHFLEVACEPWMRVLMRSPAPVAGAEIEGHASSEWRSGTSPDQAYLNNLDLSQRRSQAVLNTCLEVTQDEEVRGWAHKHLVAVGHSSARPILQEGTRTGNDRGASSSASTSMTSVFSTAWRAT